MRKTFIALLVVATLLVAAPTTIRIAMLAGPTLTAGGVLVIAPTGQIQAATLGAGITLASDGKGGFVLQAKSPNVRIGVKPTRQSDGSYLLADAAGASSLAIFRNGVRQSAGDDYTYDAGAKLVTPVAGYPWEADDLVLADYEW